MANPNDWSDIKQLAWDIASAADSILSDAQMFDTSPWFDEPYKLEKCWFDISDLRSLRDRLDVIKERMHVIVWHRQKP
jgi:hypothetical protein